MLFNMMVFVASAAQMRARTRSRAHRRSRSTSFSGQAAGARQRGMVIVHGIVTLFLEVITLAIILLVVGLAVPHVLVITLTMIMASIVSMMIIRLAIIAVASVTSMMVAVVATVMLAVAQFIMRKEDEPFSFPSTASYPSPKTLPLSNLHSLGIVLGQRWSTLSGLRPESTDPRG
jgi:hypothetical protein